MLNLVSGWIQKWKGKYMTLIDGEGRPIPPGSWGGDLDPIRHSTCRDCGTPIPFGKFCPQHLNTARQKNEQVMSEMRQKRGIDRQASLAGDAVEKSLAGPTIGPEREVDMDALAAAEQQRVQSIVTPGKPIPPAADHLAPFSGAPPVSIREIAPPSSLEKSQASARVTSDGTARNSDEFMIVQGLVWINTLRMMVEDGSFPAAQERDVRRAAAELLYALS